MPIEQRIGLDRQMVERKVRRRECERSRNIGADLGQALSGKRVHKIEVHIGEDRERGLRGGARFAIVVDSSQRREKARIEALHAERQAIHTRCPEAREPRPFKGAWIRLERDFRVRRQRQTRPYRGEDAVDGLGREKAGRPASEKNRCRAAAPYGRQRRVQIRDQCVNIFRFWHIVTALMRVEIAYGHCLRHHGMCT